MIKSHVFALSNFEEEFFIETDTSGFGIGVVLQQHDHPIAYLGKTLAPIHQSLSTYEKELLVVSATTSNELMDAVIATWSTDRYLKKVVSSLEDGSLVQSKYTWIAKELKSKGK
ncbi:reverse transcriptase [Tanacetum coccineum]